MNESTTVGSLLPDNALPSEDRQATSRRPVGKPKNPQEASESLVETSTPGNGLDSTIQPMVSLARLHPFLSLFIHYAHMRFPQRRKLESRVEAMVSASPRFYLLVRILDMVFIFLLCLLIIVALAGNIYAVFWR